MCTKIFHTKCKYNHYISSLYYITLDNFFLRIFTLSYFISGQDGVGAVGKLKWNFLLRNRAAIRNVTFKVTN